ncbi:neurogenic locus Notch protein-like isoform X2 [Danaus plexippus]|uniref:neurogenic locus Notch protein-like isoform X2 n=1 Tax=Danaus plexippus TaxID=13037 RepID=UPI0013C3F56C|nr:neurogenic locus Notch protein-like isoform X2 [Danaus plexippus]
MKCSVVAFILCLATFCRGGVIKCTPGSKDETCVTDNFGKESLVRQKRQDSIVEECSPRTEWKSKCHRCICSDSGQALCFKIEGCRSDSGEPIRCKPESKFSRDCNSCLCTNNGNVICTLKACLPSLVKEQARNDVSDDTRFRRSVAPSKPVVCAANRMFIKDCNTCWCNEDGTSFFCTRKVCVEELPEEVSEPVKIHEINSTCRPDEVFELDCNTCRCNPDGLSYSCTRRACPIGGEELPLRRKTRSTSQGTPKNCQPGQEFRMDCNKCLCDNEGQNFSCTRIDCAALNSNGNGGTRVRREVSTREESGCTPGSVFTQDCNTCRCTEDGGHATCTLKQCVKHDTGYELNQPESDPNFRCNPGEQFKRDCNDCTCSANGRGVFCTLRICDFEI